MRDQYIGAGEVAQAVELLGPGVCGVHVLRPDAVDAHVPLLELVVAGGRLDQPTGSGDDLPVTHADESDGAG